MAHCKTQFVFLIHVLPGQRNFNVISLSRTIYIYRESIYINHPNSYFISINLVQNKQNLAPCLQFWKTFQIGNGSLGLKSDIPLFFFSWKNSALITKMRQTYYSLYFFSDQHSPADMTANDITSETMSSEVVISHASIDSGGRTNAQFLLMTIFTLLILDLRCTLRQTFSGSISTEFCQ